MTAPSPVAADVLAGWDPISRPPRRTLSWLALLLVLAGCGYAYEVGRGLIEARYPAFAGDICPAVDVQPIFKALPGPIDPPTDHPIDGETPGEGVRRRCRFAITGADGVTPRAMGEMTVTRYPYAPVAQLFFSMDRSQASGSSFAPKDVREVAALGEEAFALEDGDGSFQVAARDSNLTIDLQLVVAGDVGADLARTLGDGVRSSLRRLG
ncbi:hypothetical protein COUCH_08135 [Couchioplanes caeruleus]|uniref:hypothetical protein n=1 Tax=Couchioplanes caeruleus TaxID=56438 RepID=UPI0020BE45D2|nr:hypothetical protein [Couchioplanes caeruleus]UQU66239.1 hypothetical protein COUCH_08135 [Couchioplanes caeruleus]